MPIDWESIGQGALTTGANQIVSGGLGLLLRPINDARQLRQQQKLNNQQIAANMQMADYNQKLSMDMWEKTNYSAQMKELSKAGLNPGLIYKSGGNGGTTSISNPGSINAPEAPKGGDEVSSAQSLGIELQTAQAQIELMKAEAKKANTEAEKIGGVDTDLSKGRLSKVIAETTNENLKSRLIVLDGDIKEIISSNEDERLKADIMHIKASADKLKWSNQITADTYDSIISEAKANAAGAQINNALIKAKVDLTEQERRNLIVSATQKWTELGLDRVKVEQGQQQIDLNARKVKIEQFDAEMKAEYKSVWEVAGSWLKKAYNYLEILDNQLTGAVEIRDTVPQ